MGREIKFRVWDEQEKQMIFEGFHLFGEVSIFHLIDQYLFETKGDKDTLERYNDLREMQFTGLTDKIGIEIYEGDIVKGNDNSIDVVIFRNGCFEWRGEPLNWNVASNEIVPTEQWATVIGNIYSNPELLP
jgi:uncharacterized phage protein (TIGR01671 family)